MRNVQLYATGSATGTSVAQITIPVATTIRGVHVALMVDSITDNARVQLEFSKVPSNQAGVNGAFDPFLEVDACSNFVTSGLMQGGQNMFFPLAVQCRAGEILYVHATVTGTATYYITAVFSY